MLSPAPRFGSVRLCQSVCSMLKTCTVRTNLNGSDVTVASRIEDDSDEICKDVLHYQSPCKQSTAYKTKYVSEFNTIIGLREDFLCVSLASIEIKISVLLAHLPLFCIFLMFFCFCWHRIVLGIRLQNSYSGIRGGSLCEWTDILTFLSLEGITV
jgi:hypothetical protein